MGRPGPRFLPVPPIPARRVVAIAALLFSLLSGIVAMAAAGKVNVNSASAAELQQVPGLDPNVAVRIVARRAASGPFKRLDDLLEIPGFTKFMMVQAADRLEIGPAPAPPTALLGTAAANGGKKLDLNRASFKDLLLLPEMTPRGAKAIVDYREKSHGFMSIDELDKVPGLDRRLIIQLVEQVEVGTKPGSSVASTASEKPPADTATLGEGGWNGSWVSRIEATPTPPDAGTPKPVLASGEKIDINTADRADLERLPDVGPVMSQRIVEYRMKFGAFRNVEGLLQVRGIGTQRLAEIRQYLTVGAAGAPKPDTKIAKATPRPAATPAPEQPVAKVTPRATQVARVEPTPRPTPAAKLDPPKSGRAILADGRVNINVAGIEDLLTLPRMTREAATEIVSFRQKNGPFRETHGITEVPSIGEATWARLHEKITVGE